jgi:hypothetical protein
MAEKKIFTEEELKTMKKNFMKFYSEVLEEMEIEHVNEAVSFL